MIPTMWKSLEVYNINYNDPKPGALPKPHQLTLPPKRMRCLLSPTNSDTMNKNCSPTPIDLSA